MSDLSQVREEGGLTSSGKTAAAVKQEFVPTRTQRLLQFVAFQAIVLGLALGSWVYIQSGAEEREKQRRLATVAPEYKRQWETDWGVLKQLQEESGVVMKVGDLVQSNLPSETQVNLKWQQRIHERMISVEGTANGKKNDSKKESTPAAEEKKGT